MAASIIRHAVLREVCSAGSASRILCTGLPIGCAGSAITSKRSMWSYSRYPNPKFRKQRGEKVVKPELFDFEDHRRSSKLTPGEQRAKQKKNKEPAHREFNEFDIIMASSSTIFEPYVPPEGDGLASRMSRKGAKQTKDEIAVKTKSKLEGRKVGKLDETFSAAHFPDRALDIYLETHKLLQNIEENEDRLHELVTEKAYPEMTWKLEKKTFRWKFIEAIEPPSIVHIRTQPMLSKDNLYGQVTVRFHTKQMLAIYDRFGRLMFGSDTVPKDCLEYVVYEQHLADTNGSWRIHGKIFPDWLPPSQTVARTLKKPKLDPYYELDEEGTTKSEAASSGSQVATA